jgi:hypothetical protein
MSRTTPWPTDEWLALVDGMPALTGPADTADRLLLLLHYSIDWDGWVSGYRRTYWDKLLPDRVIVATYRAQNLRRWWADVAGELSASPRTPLERAELETHLRTDSFPVLEVLRHETEPLLLRTRIVSETVRTHRAAKAS